MGPRLKVNTIRFPISEDLKPLPDMFEGPSESPVLAIARDSLLLRIFHKFYMCVNGTNVKNFKIYNNRDYE
ncbi:unnamed protein product [Paramecium pentaurelia]|uniref:Uncharacterized protein n=1 Tax=Paramecium pentaurelia TaxID=43138 RepID=A0A8S1VR97_9CILI|nr:unnamed protein product [Paramecium pentaurelia]